MKDNRSIRRRHSRSASNSKVQGAIGTNTDSVGQPVEGLQIM
jgi:hypothetical protein